MAEYHNLTIVEINSIIQSEKSGDKKFFYGGSIRGKNTKSTVSENVSQTFCKSIAINFEKFMLREINITKFVSYFTATPTTFISESETILPSFGYKDTVLIGISDHELPSTIPDIKTFNSNNIILIPCKLDSHSKLFSLKNIQETFQRQNNALFLNIFLKLESENTGDQTNFFNYIDFVFNYPTATFGGWNLDYSIFISGRGL